MLLRQALEQVRAAQEQREQAAQAQEQARARAAFWQANDDERTPASRWRGRCGYRRHRDHERD